MTKNNSIWKPLTSLIKDPVIPRGFLRPEKNRYISFSVFLQENRTKVVEFISEYPDGEFVSLEDFFEDYEATKQELSELRERVKKLEALTKSPL